MSTSIMPQRAVGILIFDDVEVLDFCGPFEVFSVASETSTHDGGPPLFQVVTIAERPGTVTCRGGLLVRPHHTIDDHPPLDILVVPGGAGVVQVRDNPSVLDWIADQVAGVELTTSVCTGATLLAARGLLDGRRATTHWGSITWLREHHPAIEVVEGTRYVDTGSVIIAAGVSAGIDTSLHIVARLHARGPRCSNRSGDGVRRLPGIGGTRNVGHAGRRGCPMIAREGAGEHQRAPHVFIQTPGAGAALRQRTRSEGTHLIAGWGYGLLIAVLIVALAAAILTGISIGTVTLPFHEVWAVVIRHLTGGTANTVDDRIIWAFRAPRVLLAALIGAGLSVAGAALQTLVRNPLADPYVLGVSSGASLAAVAVILLGSPILASLGVSLAAFIGAVVTMLAVMAIGQRAGRFSPSRLVLAGVAIGALASSVTSYLQIKADPQQLQGVIFWLLGTVSGATWSDLGIPSLAVLLGTAWLLVQARRLNALLMGEESAVALGVDVNRFRVELILVSSALTGAAVAVAGGIGFVGLMVPHVARMLVGPDHRRMLPAAALIGATYLVLVDLLARTLQRPVELPLGIFTAAIGAPFFIWLMRRNSRLAGST